MQDIDTFSRRFGLFQQRSTKYKRINEISTNPPLTTNKNSLSIMP